MGDFVWIDIFLHHFVEQKSTGIIDGRAKFLYNDVRNK